MHSGSNVEIYIMKNHDIFHINSISCGYIKSTFYSKSMIEVFWRKKKVLKNYRIFDTR